MEAEDFLETIAADLRALLPFEAQLPSETIVFSQVGPVNYILKHSRKTG